MIYHPRRRRKPRWEVHKLVNGKYQLQSGNPVWLAEIGLGIGCERNNYCGLTREWLYWYDEEGKRYPTPEEQIKEAQKRAELAAKLAQEEARRAQEEARRAQQLAEQLRALGVDPDNLN